MADRHAGPPPGDRHQPGHRLSKLAEDLEIWDSQEFDFVDLAEAYTRSSVLMPQKRNPYALSIVRGAAGVLIGRLTGLLAVVKTPSARTDNLIFAYGEVPRALTAVGRSTRLMRGVIDTLHVNAARMAQVLQQSFAQATDVAEHVMMSCGLDYRSAYLVVGEAVRHASASGKAGVDIDGAALDRAASVVLGEPLGLAGTDLRPATDPARLVATRDVPGGAAPHLVRDMAARAARRADALAAAARAEMERFDAAEAALIDAARRLAGGDVVSPAVQ